MDLQRRDAVQKRRSASILAFVLVAGVLGAACATKARTGAAGPIPPSATVVQVTPSDTGKTIGVHVGDTLRILLGPPAGQSFLTWTLQSYPKDLLSLSPRDQMPRDEFDLVANAEGRGTVSVVGAVRCEGGPGPYAAGVQCPVLGVGSDSGGTPSPAASGGGHAVPARLLTFVVVITA
ncbi:MAG TPA: hypothetical protein VGA30_04795 [Actinomycetota bacterium]